MKPKMSRKAMIAMAKRLVRRYYRGAKCRKSSAKCYIIQVPADDDSFFAGWLAELATGESAGQAWLNAFGNWLAKMVLKDQYRQMLQEMYEETMYPKPVVFYAEDAMAIKDSPDVSIIGIDEWVDDMKKAPGV